MLKKKVAILTPLLSLFIVFSVYADEVKTKISGQNIVATQMTKKLAFELVRSVPEKSKFESYEDLLVRYKELIPKNWFYLDFDFDKVKYNVSKRRFEWESGPLAQFEWETPLGQFKGQNAYGAKANVESGLYELVNLSLNKNITVDENSLVKRVEKARGVELSAASRYQSVANYLLTQGFASLEPFVFEVAPQLAEKITSVRVFFKINSLHLIGMINEATVSKPTQTIVQAADLGISKDSILRINNSDYSFYESDIKWEHTSGRGFKIKSISSE